MINRRLTEAPSFVIPLFVLCALLYAQIATATPSAGSSSASSDSAAPREAGDSVPSPANVLGFEPGADRKLADWSRIVGYFKKLAAASPRVSLQQPGVTTEGRPFVYALISSEENIRNLDAIRDAQHKLADPRWISSDEERDRLIRETPAVVAITCSIHSTEIGASQMSMELAYRLASDNSPRTRQILSNVVLLLVPSVNPDGIDIVANWYRKTLGTKYEGTPPPVLYHHYTGHDDNRDWFMLTQVETRELATVLWKKWFPEIVYDVHQQGQYGSRICVPPFFDPPNPNIDPLILREVGWIGERMAVNLTAAGFKGVVSNSTYDTWWHGGLRTAPYYHNEIGILTEAASVKIATPLEVKRDQLKAPVRGLNNPLATATNFPVAWEGGTWRLKDIVDMELVTTRTMLDEASLHKEELISAFVNVARHEIEMGESEAPYAYVIPSTQHDLPTAERMIDILLRQGVEVHYTKSKLTVGANTYGPGSFVILMNQPYRSDVKCLFEAQHYPDRRLYQGGPAEPPYDVAGWTLPMQMGVDYKELDQPLDRASLARIERFGDKAVFAEAISRIRTVDRSTSTLRDDENGAFETVNDCLNRREQCSVSRARTSTIAENNTAERGWFIIKLHGDAHTNTNRYGAARVGSLNQPDAQSNLAKPLRPDVLADLRQPSRQSTSQTAPTYQLAKPRLAVYRSWVPSMDEGWLRWVLEQFKFDYTTIYDADLRKGELRSRFDVVIIPDEGAAQIINGNKPGSYPDEYTGGMGDAGVENLKTFASNGGVLIFFNQACQLAMKRFDLPVKNALDGLKRDQFYAPGSIFRANIDNSNPIAYGMPSQADLYFISGVSRRDAEAPRSTTSAAPAAVRAAPTPSAFSRSRHDDSQKRTAPDQVEPSAQDGRGLLVSAFAFDITNPSRATSVARYVDDNPLRSGWLLGPKYIEGKSALVEVKFGKGRVVLFGFPPEHRGQTWGTFKLLFNSILLGGSSNR